MTPPDRRPAAFVHVDVDGQWALRRCHGLPEGDTLRRDVCWQQGLPALRDLIEERRLPASFFLVGRDLGVASKRRAARALADAGHELGNHSFTHHLGLTLLPDARLAREIAATNDAFAAAKLPRPAGFRSPGYATDRRVRRAVREAGMRYDASLLATWLTWPLRAADALATRRWDPRKRQFGRLRDALCSRHPHRRAGGLWELPVATLGVLGWPLTGAGILALGARRVVAMLDRQRRRRGLPVLLLLHAADLVDWRDGRELGMQPPRAGGFTMAPEDKRPEIGAVLDHLAQKWDVRRSDQWVAEQAAAEAQRPVFLPRRMHWG